MNPTTAQVSPLHPTARVRAALARGLATDYGQRCIAQRVPGPAQAGSCFDAATAEEAVAALLGATWSPLADSPLADAAKFVQAPAVAFVAEVPGRLGLVALRELPADFEVSLEDPKGTGFVSVVAELPLADRPPVALTTAILGPDDHGEETLWTVHPGAPIPPSTLPATGPSGDLAGKRLSAGDAAALGFGWAKIR
jgi:hypothetical protein